MFVFQRKLFRNVEKIPDSPEYTIWIKSKSFYLIKLFFEHLLFIQDDEWILMKQQKSLCQFLWKGSIKNHFT